LKPLGYLVAFVFFITSVVLASLELITPFQQFMVSSIGILFATTGSILDHVEEIKEKIK